MVEDPGSSLEPDGGFESLVTDRLTIRRFEVTDVRAFASYRSVPEVARYQSWDTPFSEEQARRFVTAQAASHPDTPEGGCPASCLSSVVILILFQAAA